MFDIASRGKACSTLVFGRVFNGSSTSRKCLADALEYQIAESEKSSAIERQFNQYSSTHYSVRQILDGYKVRQFALFYGTCYEHYMDDEKKKVFESFGFRVLDDMPTYNSKNSTTVIPIIGAVPVVLKRLKQFRDEERKASESKKIEKKKVAA